MDWDFPISWKEFLPQNLPQFFTRMKISSTLQLWIASLRGQRRSLVSFVWGACKTLWSDNLRPLYGLLCAFLRFVLGGENLLREQYRRKDTIKAAKILGFLLDSSQILDVKFRRDQDLKHLMVTKSSIRTGSGIDNPKVEPEPIKSHHKISVLSDRIRSRFLAVVACDETMLRSDV